MMTTENKCCGNCKHFQNESATGNGWCNENDWISNVDKVCKCHEDIDNGWTEITPDNENELTDELSNRIIIGFKDCEGRMHTMTLLDCYMGVGTMAKHGDYFYYVLPELRIE